jgi:hypothetical protein
MIVSPDRPGSSMKVSSVFVSSLADEHGRAFHSRSLSSRLLFGGVTGGRLAVHFHWLFLIQQRLMSR